MRAFPIYVQAIKAARQLRRLRKAYEGRATYLTFLTEWMSGLCKCNNIDPALLDTTPFDATSWSSRTRNIGAGDRLKDPESEGRQKSVAPSLGAIYKDSKADITD